MTTATSLAAYAAIEPYAPTLGDKIMRLLTLTSGGCTDEEIRVALNLHYGSACARRKELQNAGKIEDSGFRGTTSSGRAAIIWRVTGK